MQNKGERLARATTIFTKRTTYLNRFPIWFGLCVHNFLHCYISNLLDLLQSQILQDCYEYNLTFDQKLLSAIFRLDACFVATRA